MSRLKIFSLCGVLAICFFSCSGKKTEKQQETEPQEFLGYNLNKPVQDYELPKDLEEISGLAFISAGLLLANQDEEGILFFYNIAKGSVENKNKWGKKGDYEGAAFVKQTAYITDSKGTIYQIKNYNSKNPEVEEFKSKAPEECDAEGLTYLEEGNALLIACKEGSGKENRKIYSFSLDSMALNPEPYRTLRLKEIEDFLLTTGLDKFSLNMKKMLDPDGESGILYPSGIAIHPITKDLYVLSAKSRLMMVYTSGGKLKDVAELTSEKFTQPEAITFTPNGDLYIGNEALNKKKATILKFEYVQE